METYQTLREFADSWWLLVMFAFFVAVVLWTFRPGSKRTHDDIADIPLRDDDLSRLRDRTDDDEGRRGEGRGEGRDRAERMIPKET